MSNIKKWILAFAIAIVLNLFVNYGISVVYKAPQFDDFCREGGIGPYPAKPYPYPYPLEQQQKECKSVELIQELQSSCSEQKGYVAYKYNATGCPTEAYCETCQARFNDVSQKRNSNVFVILVVAGVAAILAGMVVNAEAVANGFLIGGIISLVIAAIRNWGQLQDVLKLIILGVVLALLIWIGYKKTGLMGKGKVPQQPQSAKQQKKQQLQKNDKQKRK